MKTLIAYTTKYGSTEECAKKISMYVGGDVRLLDVRKQREASAEGYDNVILGSPIYVGRIDKEMLMFCKANSEALKLAKVGLFVLNLQQDGLKELEASFPHWLVAGAHAKAALGGRLTFDALTFPDRMVAGMLSKVDRTIPPMKKGDVFSSVSEHLLRGFAGGFR